MSLLEDLRHVLYVVLEYFGVPPDMLVPVWDSQLCGSHRSIVRMIGTNLPLAPLQRVYFQIPMLSNKPQGCTEFTVETAAIPTFADVLWVYEDEGDSFAKTRNHLPPRKESTVLQKAARSQVATLKPAMKVGPQAKQAADPSALEKISALESELLKLRAQIAMIITAAPGSGPVESQNAPGTPGMSPPPPVCTSTPRCVVAPPPPPPPPPPPLCSSSSNETCSALELIRQRQKGKGPTAKKEEVKGIPSMLDVLKDLNQVKLRSVNRSPGGTPVRRRRSKGVSASLGDPAALIAEALKRKFAQHQLNNSSDKENSLDLSPFGSPETPKVTHQTRRSQGRLLI